MADLDVPEGFALLCGICRWRIPLDITVALVKAHMETEHDTDAVALELVALCPRCDQPMRFDYTIGDEDHFECDRCKRSRTVRRAGG